MTLHYRITQWDTLEWPYTFSAEQILYDFFLNKELGTDINLYRI